jgi:hypothetical protein
MVDVLFSTADALKAKTAQSKRFQNRSRIHERTISVRFLGIILRFLRFEVSVYKVYITNQFQTTFAQVRE